MPRKTLNKPGEKHYHTLKRMKTKSGRKDVYKCMHPECSYYANKELLDGKSVRCWFCHGIFQLTPYTLRLKIPHCGCRGLSDIQRLKIQQLSAEDIDQTALAMTILKSIEGNDETS